MFGFRKMTTLLKTLRICLHTCCMQCIEEQNSIGAAVSPSLQPASTLHAYLAGGSGKQQQLSVPPVSNWHSPHQVLCSGLNSCATHLPACQVACCVVLFTIVHSSSSLDEFLPLRNNSVLPNTGIAAGQAEKLSHRLLSELQTLLMNTA